MQWWKWLGLAGLAGVAASGAVVKRDQRQRNAYSKDEMRARIHERAEDALASEADVPQAGSGES
jgi:uncharacterized protein YqfA (UPF0365 family)